MEGIEINLGWVFWKLKLVSFPEKSEFFEAKCRGFGSDMSLLFSIENKLIVYNPTKCFKK